MKIIKIAQLIMSQKEAMDKFMPLIEKDGVDYEKFTKVYARPAKEGEVIDTYTSDGKETTGTAKKGDYVVKNMTEAKEEYIINEKKLKDRYKKLNDEKDGEWDKYQAVGKCRGIVYKGEEIKFMATWNEEMVLKSGDMIVTTPKKDEVYRIAIKEFKETYRKQHKDNS